MTVTGRIVDNIRMLGAGLKGDEHRECAVGGDRAGVRMALLDGEANVLYPLMADRPFGDPNGLIREHLEHVDAGDPVPGRLRQRVYRGTDGGRHWTAISRGRDDVTVLPLLSIPFRPA